jgi:hypothetical protein
MEHLVGEVVDDGNVGSSRDVSSVPVTRTTSALVTEMILRVTRIGGHTGQCYQRRRAPSLEDGVFGQHPCRA